MNRGRFWLTVVSVNWGRGYDPGEFRRNVLNVLEFTEGREHVVILPQELDEEPDAAHEHRRFGSVLEPGCTKVHWPTREPIVLSPPFNVVHRRRVKIMGSGIEIGAPRGTGPARHLSMCVAELDGVRLAFGNFHPHRNLPNPRVQEARDRAAELVSLSLRRLRGSGGGTSGVYGTDYNAVRMPRMVPGEEVAHHQGLDHLHYWQHPDGARLELRAHGALAGTIDPHDPIWARFLVTSGAA